MNCIHQWVELCPAWYDGDVQVREFCCSKEKCYALKTEREWIHETKANDNAAITWPEPEGAA